MARELSPDELDNEDLDDEQLFARYAHHDHMIDPQLSARALMHFLRVRSSRHYSALLVRDLDRFNDDKPKEGGYLLYDTATNPRRELAKIIYDSPEPVLIVKVNDNRVIKYAQKLVQKTQGCVKLRLEI